MPAKEGFDSNSQLFSKLQGEYLYSHWLAVLFITAHISEDHSSPDVCRLLHFIYKIKCKWKQHVSHLLGYIPY